jgi:nitroreductase
MDVFEAVRTVLAVRSYRSDPIPQEVVARIVEAGRLTGSSMNGQPWHFVVVDDKSTIQRMGQLAKSGPYITQAPLVIVVAIGKTVYGVSDGSRAIQSMVLTAWADGVGSNWVGFSNLEEIRTLLAVPDDYEILAALPFGYPVDPGGQGKKKRKPLAEVASHGRFGQPFPE